DLLRGGDEVAEPPLDPCLETRLAKQLRGERLVLRRELDVRRVGGAGLQELELDRAGSAADLEHRIALDASAGEEVDDPPCRAVEPAPPVPADVAPRGPLAEDPPVAGRCAATRHRTSLGFAGDAGDHADALVRGRGRSRGVARRGVRLPRGAALRGAGRTRLARRASARPRFGHARQPEPRLPEPEDTP